MLFSIELFESKGTKINHLSSNKQTNLFIPLLV
jgi:hypothetical protein